MFFSGCIVFAGKDWRSSDWATLDWSTIFTPELACGDIRAHGFLSFHFL